MTLDYCSSRARTAEAPANQRSFGGHVAEGVNHLLGSACRKHTDFVGGGARPMTGSDGLVGQPFQGSDGNIYRRVYRSPSEKTRSPYTKTGKQANYVTERLDTKTETTYPKGKAPQQEESTSWTPVSNGHVDITD